MAKKLKLWNGGRGIERPHNNHYGYVAAYSQQEAANLLSKALYGKSGCFSVNILKHYWHDGGWGNRMDGIEPIEPCVYLCDETIPGNKPFRLI